LRRGPTPGACQPFAALGPVVTGDNLLVEWRQPPAISLF